MVPTHPGTFSRSFVRPFTEPNLPIDNSGNFLAPFQDESNHANVKEFMEHARYPLNLSCKANKMLSTCVEPILPSLNIRIANSHAKIEPIYGSSGLTSQSNAVFNDKNGPNHECQSYSCHLKKSHHSLMIK